MGKFWKAFGVGLAGATALLIATGNGFLLRAVALNLKKKPFTPSLDDGEHFPYHTIATDNPQHWEKDDHYNQKQLPEKILDELKKSRGSALLVIKNGKLMHEEYWNGHTASSLMNSFSMAKGFLSILVGIAVKEGKIKSENQHFSDFYPSYALKEFGKDLTLKHLMTMQAGLDWAEKYHHPFAPNSKQYYINDLGNQVFDVKFKQKPGVCYEYQSAAPQLLGFALRKAVGESLAFYLSEKIWKPLGMEQNAKWSIDENGMEKAFCCIHACARDFAKIGQLILNKGSWNGASIVDKDYLDKMLCPTAENDAFCYTVWADDESKVKHRFFYGFLGQFIIVLPEKEMVIVKTGHYNRMQTDEKLRPLQVRMFAEELSELFG